MPVIRRAETALMVSGIKAEEIIDRLKGLGDEQSARHSQRFFKTGKGQYGEGDIFLGIRVPVIRACVGEYGHIPTAELQRLLKSPFHEVRLFALLAMVERFKRGGEKEKKEIYNLYIFNTDHVNNWDLVDSSAHHIVGAFLEGRGKGPLEKLAGSEKVWERRIAIIATFYMIRKNDFEDALNISRMLVYDGHDLIQKAVGWMLREIGKRDLDAEKKFLKEHYKRMPRTMLRYAIERFPEIERKKYLAGSI